ncbi:MAG: DUF1501 domain-containing protein [Bacteroidota bacterium]
MGGNPLFLNRVALATRALSPFEKRKILVAIFQRGAMDGLMAVTPFNDPMLMKLRPRLGMSAAQSKGAEALLDLDGRFGLHPALSPFGPLYKEGRLAIVHGVGSPDPTRSHFDAQDYMETGTPGRKGTQSGWLNRASGLLGHDATPFRAVALTPALPRSLYGDFPALAIANLDDFGVRVPGGKSLAQAAGESFETLYEQTSQQLLQGTGKDSFDAIKILSKAEVQKYRPAEGVEYPKSPLGHSLSQIAQLVKSDVGLEVAFAETIGWDTHVQQGTVNGQFAAHANDLSRSIAAFWKDVEPYQDDIVLMTMTEFGRTVHENGSGGTDHGRASCSFILGNAVSGGKVYGEVPALVPEQLDDRRDLPVTTDFRAMFSEVAGKHLNTTKEDILFPGWNGQPLSFLKK